MPKLISFTGESIQNHEDKPVTSSLTPLVSFNPNDARLVDIQTPAAKNTSTLQTSMVESFFGGDSSTADAIARYNLNKINTTEENKKRARAVVASADIDAINQLISTSYSEGAAEDLKSKLQVYPEAVQQIREEQSDLNKIHGDFVDTIKSVEDEGELVPLESEEEAWRVNQATHNMVTEAITSQMNQDIWDFTTDVGAMLIPVNGMSLWDYTDIAREAGLTPQGFDVYHVLASHIEGLQKLPPEDRQKAVTFLMGVIVKESGLTGSNALRAASILSTLISVDANEIRKQGNWDVAGVGVGVLGGSLDAKAVATTLTRFIATNSLVNRIAKVSTHHAAEMQTQILTKGELTNDLGIAPPVAASHSSIMDSSSLDAGYNAAVASKTARMIQNTVDAVKLGVTKLESKRLPEGILTTKDKSEIFQRLADTTTFGNFTTHIAIPDKVDPDGVTFIYRLGTPNGGYKSKLGAQSALSRSNINKAGVALSQADDGEWYITLTQRHDWSIDDIIPFSSNKIPLTPLGRFLYSAQTKLGFIDPDIVPAASRLEMGQAYLVGGLRKLHSTLLDSTIGGTWRVPLTKSNKRYHRVMEVLESGDKESLTYLPTTLKARFGLDDGEMTAYYGSRQFYDELFMLRNNTTRNVMDFRGVKLLQGVRRDEFTYGTPYDNAAKAFTNVHDLEIFDATKGTYLSKLRQDDVDNIYSQNKKIVKFEDPHTLLGENKYYSYAVVDDTNIKPLGPIVLNYKTGYVPKINKNVFYTTTQWKAALVNGETKTIKHKTLRISGSMADAKKVAEKEIELRSALSSLVDVTGQGIIEAAAKPKQLIQTVPAVASLVRLAKEAGINLIWETIEKGARPRPRAALGTARGNGRVIMPRMTLEKFAKAIPMSPEKVLGHEMGHAFYRPGDEKVIGRANPYLRKILKEVSRELYFDKWEMGRYFDSKTGTIKRVQASHFNKSKELLADAFSSWFMYPEMRAKLKPLDAALGGRLSKITNAYDAIKEVEKIAPARQLFNPAAVKWLEDNGYDVQEMLDAMKTGKIDLSTDIRPEFSRDRSESEEMLSDIGNSRGLFTGSRASELKYGADGADPLRENPYKALQRNIDNIGVFVPRNEWRVGMQLRFMQTWRRYLKDKDSSFRDAQIADTAPAAVKAGFNQTKEYLNAQLRIRSNEESTLEEWAKSIAIWAENKPVPDLARYSLLSFNYRDPLAVFRTMAFHTMLGVFNPVQTFIQAQGASIALSTHPVFGAKAMLRYPALRAVLSDNADEGVRDLIMTRYADAGGQELKDIREVFIRTGWRDSISTNADIAAGEQGFGIARGVLRDVLSKGTLFYREGEFVTRGIAVDIAYQKWLAKGNKPGNLLDDDMKDITNEALRLTLNMSRANRAAWQEGILANPTQFYQIQAKMLEAVMGKEGFTKSEGWRIGVGQALLYGALGIPFLESLMTFGLEQAGIDPEELSKETKIKLRGGFEDWFVSSVLGIDVRVANRGAIAGQVAENLGNLLFGDHNLWGLMGASGTPVTRSFVALQALEPLIVNAKKNENIIPSTTAIQVFFEELASITSTGNNLKKAYYWHTTKQMWLKNGEVLFEKDPEFLTSAARAIGFQSIEEADTYALIQINKYAKDNLREITEDLKTSYNNYLHKIKGGNPEEVVRLVETYNGVYKLMTDGLNPMQIQAINKEIFGDLVKASRGLSTKSEDVLSHALLYYLENSINSDLYSRGGITKYFQPSLYLNTAVQPNTETK